MKQYQYGENVPYNFELLNPNDCDKLKNFDCGNIKLNNFIQNEIIQNAVVVNEDGLMFKAENTETNEIVAVVSLAANGIIFHQTNFLKILPAIKIDIFAVDLKYQKLHINKDSESSSNPDDHFYLSDSIMSDIISHCNVISDTKVLVDYILLYADEKAYRFYERNLFVKFEEFMQKENNMEISKNIPMYMKLSG